MPGRDQCKDSVAAVLEAFALGEPESVELLGGTATPKFAVRVPRGRFVVRVRPAEFQREDFIRFDHEALWRLANEGLPVPRPQRKNDGTSWMRLAGQTFEVLSWVRGDPFQWNDHRAVRNVGEFLARFHTTLTDDVPSGKDGFVREDHPDLLEQYVREIEGLCSTGAQTEQVARVGEQLDIVRESLDNRLWPRLPKAVIHGDVHPGNLQFKDSKVAAVFDFDYLSLQARARDLGDALMFFAARHDPPLDPDDIYSLTGPFEFDLRRSAILMEGYQQVSPLTDVEWEALPLLIRSLWVQNRLRGSRKVPRGDKLHFVLHRFFEIIRWLDEDAPDCFKRLRGGC